MNSAKAIHGHMSNPFYYQLEDIVLELHFLARKMSDSKCLNEEDHNTLRSLADAIADFNKQFK